MAPREKDSTTGDVLRIQSTSLRIYVKEIMARADGMLGAAGRRRTHYGMLEAAEHEGLLCNGMWYTLLWATTAVAAPRLSRCSSSLTSRCLSQSEKVVGLVRSCTHWTCSHDTGHIWEEILPHPSESMSWTLKDLERQAFAVFWGMIRLSH